MKKGFFLFIFVVVSCLLRAQTHSQIVLDSVVVASSYPEGKQDLSVEVRRWAEKDRLAGKEMPYLLEMTPGVVSYSDNGTGVGSTSFRIRGTDPGRTNISIDGIPLNDAESQSVFWVNIPNLGMMTKRLAIQRGAGSTAFGTAAFGGAVDINTGYPSDRAEGYFTGSCGSFNTQNVGLNLSTGKLFNAVAFDGQYYRQASEGYLDRSGSRRQSARIGAGWAGKTSLLKVTLLYGEEHSRLSFDGVPYDSLETNRRYNMSGRYADANGNTQFYENEMDNYQQTHAHLHYLQKTGGRWTLNTALYYTKGLGYYEQYKQDRKLSDYGILPQGAGGTTHAKSDLIRRKGLDNDFYGLSLSGLYTSNRWQINLSAGANRYVGDHIGKIMWVKYNAGDVEYNRNWYDNTGTKNEANLFAKATYHITRSLSVFGDLQYRHVNFKLYGQDDDYFEYPEGFLDTTYVWNFVNPQIGVAFQPGKAHQAYLSFALLNREPNRSDLKNTERNRVTAETLYDAEAGYRFNNDFFTAGVNLYYMYYGNQLVATGRVNDSYRPVMENAPKSYRMGVELSAAVHFERVKIEGNLSLSRNKLLDYTNYVYVSDYSAQVEEFSSSVDIAYSPSAVGAFIVYVEPVKQLQLAIAAKYVGRQYYDNTGSADRMLEAYLPFNFNASYDFPVNHVDCFLQLVVNNIFNIKYSSSAFVYDRTVHAAGVTDYQDRRYFPQAGTNFALKLGVRF
ncbi:MAG: TonB-dependent receptor [Prevotellaceae bacterium]|jgi:iron complex outermembrane receptor protein|nr:TonB-dependent receptor [Prevotellaceae bacterium]